MRLCMIVACLCCVGGGLYGQLPESGVGEATDEGVVRPLQRSASANAKANAKLLLSLGSDSHEEELHRLAVEDAKLGRLSYPKSLSERGVTPHELEGIRICPR